MFTSRWLLGVLVLAMLPISSSGQTDNYWLILEVTGQWEYRVGDEEPRQLTGGYEPLSPEGQVRCLEPDVSRCELRYLANSHSMETQRLAVKLGQSKQWVALKRLKPPPLPILPATSSELAAKFGRITRAGGSRAASACGGDFPLKAPRCGENVDPATFTVRWLPTTSQTITILVERADGQPALFRGAGAGAAGAFTDPRLTSFLRATQSPTEPVDITVRVLAEGGKSAVRLVRIPPAVRTMAFEARVRTIGLRSDAARAVTLMTLAMEESMWSRAAEEATKLVALAGSSLRLLEYALLGFCQSDFSDEKARLVKYIPARRYDEICAPESTSVTTTAAAAAPAPDESAATNVPVATSAPVSKSRMGIALLIGNSDYWNLPLNSVRNDIRGMEDTLKALGFAVTTKVNLRTPRQFTDALEEVLKRENATWDDVLLLYYSGHGVQLDGKAHLLTTGVSSAGPAAEDLRDNAQSAEDLLAQMERSIPGTRILIIEACRNDILSARSAAASAVRGGFAFQQDDVPNTFVMFANKPGLPAAVRSDFGLMGPFTEALVHALENSAGAISEVYEKAREIAREISPAQDPVLYRSKSVTPVTLTRQTAKLQDSRAKQLLNSAEPLYRNRAWEEFRATVQRGKALASNPQVQQRLGSEIEFATLVMNGTALEKALKWTEAAEQWQKAHDLFIRREWVGMNAAVAWLLADNPSRAVGRLAALAAQSDTEIARQARQMLGELTEVFPALAAEAQRASGQATKVPAGAEFETIADEGVTR